MMETTVDGGDGSVFMITLEDVLSFVNGGYTNGVYPAINFSFATTLPIASTCCNALTLPLGLPYTTFRYNLAFGMKHSFGFQCLHRGVITNPENSNKMANTINPEKQLAF